uniref:Hydrolase_4 domain-containing protein n=1 Tax=Elaeophora elaphi TaxID=1147741 RepID=A0A0R3S0P3_9BILA
MNKLAPIVFYCHGLGATAQSGTALLAKKFVESRGLQFKSIKYRNFDCKNYIWNVDDWLNDLLMNIEECRKQQRLSLLFGCSAGCHSILRATLLKPQAICGLMLLSPGVGLSLKSYIQIVMPQFWEKILADENVAHPSSVAEHIPPIMVNRKCLQHYIDTCVNNRMTSIPIHCPVRIMHGSNDKVVPLLNVKKFKEKLESKDVILSVINGSGHHLPFMTEFEKLFDSLLRSVQQADYRML